MSKCRSAGQTCTAGERSWNLASILMKTQILKEENHSALKKTLSGFRDLVQYTYTQETIKQTIQRVSVGFAFEDFFSSFFRKQNTTKHLPAPWMLMMEDCCYGDANFNTVACGLHMNSLF